MIHGGDHDGRTLVYDLAKQHVAELLAERELDRLAAQVPDTKPGAGSLVAFLKTLLPTHAPRQQWRSRTA